MTTEKLKLRRPTLIVGMGWLAAGKSTTFAGVVERVEGAINIKKDIINDALNWEPVALSRDDPASYRRDCGRSWKRSDPYYLLHVCMQSYECMLQIGLSFLEQGKHPILEGDFGRMIGGGYFDTVVLPAIGRTGRDIAFKIVYVAAPVEILKERIQKRSAAHDQAYAGTDLDAYFAIRPVVPEEVSRYPHFVVWTHQPIDWDGLLHFLAE